MTKRERCIRAACEAEPNNAKQYPCEYPTCICARDFEKRIDAIFAELEKPDEAMKEAVAKPELGGEIWLDDDEAERRWKRGLRAAAGGGDGKTS